MLHCERMALPSAEIKTNNQSCGSNFRISSVIYVWVNIHVWENMTLAMYIPNCLWMHPAMYILY